MLGREAREPTEKETIVRIFGGIWLGVLLSAVAVYGQEKAAATKPTPQPTKIAKPESVKVGLKMYSLGSPIQQVLNDKERYKPAGVVPDQGIKGFVLREGANETLAGFPLVEATLVYQKDVLGNITLVVDGAWRQIVEAMSDKYGKPSQMTKPKEYKDFEVANWEIGDNKITVLRMSESPATSVFYCTDAGSKTYGILTEHNKQQEKIRRANDL